MRARRTTRSVPPRWFPQGGLQKQLQSRDCRSSRASFDNLRGPRDGGDDSRIGATAADVAVHKLDDLFFAGLWRFIQKGDAGDNHSGCAVPALQGVGFEECLL